MRFPSLSSPAPISDPETDVMSSHPDDPVATSMTPMVTPGMTSTVTSLTTSMTSSESSDTSHATITNVTPPATTTAAGSSAAAPTSTPSTGAGAFFRRYSNWSSSLQTNPATSVLTPNKTSPKPPIEVTIVSETPKFSASDDASTVSTGGSDRTLDDQHKQTKKSTTAKKMNKVTLGGARACQTHSFQTDAFEVQHMEKGLLKLLDDFNSGKLRAFGQGCSMEQMERLRDQQESLAKLHFELGARQDIFAPLSEEGLRASNENMDKLMDRLEKLSISIGHMNPANRDELTPIPEVDVTNGHGKTGENGGGSDAGQSKES